jgi:SAM-dependent methyltransferase
MIDITKRSPSATHGRGFPAQLKDVLTNQTFSSPALKLENGIMDGVLNKIIRKISLLYMSKEIIYEDKYFHYNHIRHINARYSFIIKLYYRYIASLCMALPANTHPGARVLDIGCGIGILVQQFNKLGYQAIGVDVNQCAIENSVSSSNCFLVKTTANLDYPRRYFDLVVSRECLEHIPEPEIDNCIIEWDRVGNGCMVHIIATTERGESAINDPLHVNVKPQQWWIDKFAAFGYKTIRSPMKLFFSPFGSTGYFMMVKERFLA